MKKPILFAVLFVMVLASVAAILQSGWTSTTNPGVARTALGVPGLTNNNVFTGSNRVFGSFTGNLNGATNYNSSNLVGTVWGGISNPATGGNKLVIDQVNGNVGINTATPLGKLDVNGLGIMRGIFLVTAAGGVIDPTAVGIELRGGGFPSLTTYNRSTSTYLMWIQDALTHEFQIEGSAKMFISTAGNVGIGTTTPISGKLVVAGSITADTDDTGGIGAVGANRFNNIQIGTGASAFAGGIASARSNLLAAATITVTASPFNWTNTANVNVTVYVDGISVTGTVGINGGTVFNSIGQNTIILQPNGWTTITYTLGTPTATWKPF